MTDDDADAGLAVAAAFRQALEADTLQLLGAQSEYSSSANGSPVFVTTPGGPMKALLYYPINASWFQKAWSTVLMPPKSIPVEWAEVVGPIDNSGIAQIGAIDRAQSVKLDDNQSTASQLPSTILLRSDLQHEQDFYLVGSQSWLLLANKFGAQNTCSKPVVAHKLPDSTLAVDLGGGVGPTNLVPIPASGRFPYEQIVPPKPAVLNSEKIPQEDDDMPDLEPPNNNDDDNIGRIVHVSKKQNEESAVLLLPASTTPNDSEAAKKEDSSFRTSTNTDDYWRMETDDTGDASNFTTITRFIRYKYGSGLGNLGNTCFMNSTLQCLGHTHALQKYFLTGEFRSDLNRGNPLGTGGELASAFAKLLTEMWSSETTTTISKYVTTDEHHTTRWSSDTGHTVYPRDFKFTVGEHAEQFMGYDQHDSQEFATYLLDALHEDTNRVTQKPYFDKPEQEEGESDEAAADKAWNLHLQRENSRVLENFMGQVKSRVQCCEAGCSRVSTTFDPFMFLSVPIPGSQDREVKTTYVPLDPSKRVQSVSVTIPKTSNVQELAKRTLQLVQKRGIDVELGEDDLTAVDIFNSEPYNWYSPDDDIERIKDNDETWVFGLRPLAEIREEAEGNENNGNKLGMYNIESTAQAKRYKLDLATLTRLNKHDAWTNEFSKYLSNSLGFIKAFHRSNGNTDDQVKFFQKTSRFLDACHEKIKDLETAKTSATYVNEDSVKEIIECCERSPSFENVSSLHDLAVLEFCQGQMRKEILRLIEEKKNSSSGGVEIYIKMKINGGLKSQLPPLVLRIPSSMSTFDLRQAIATRLSRSLRLPEDTHKSSSSSGQATSESEGALEMSGATYSHNFDVSTFGSPELFILRQIPLTFERKSPGYPTKSLPTKLGSVSERSYHPVGDSSRLASATDEEERKAVARVVGDHGYVTVAWPKELADRAFDSCEYSDVEDPEKTDSVTNGAPMTRARKASNKVCTVLDCIEKYCQMEQLEETEMWYCNRCKKHVRAWKQFHLYRTPPVLIVHLKRFQYSATTHRRDKISKFIDFPLQGLDLSGQVKCWADGEEPIYDCYAVSNHYGGLGGGHYTAHALNDDGVWCYYDDSRVSKDLEISSIRSDAAYVLYYRRRGPLNDPDFLLKLQTQDSLLPDQGPAIISDAPAEAQNTSNVSGSDVVEDDEMDVDSHTSHGSMDAGAEFQETGLQYRTADEEEPRELPRQ